MIPPPQPTGLFDRLHGNVFAVLAGPNRARMWGLLMDLYNGFFGPDAPPIAEDGVSHRQITLTIEHHLINHASWDAEDGLDPLTPVSVRANLLLQRLVATGWLKEERIGVKNFIVMPPTMGKFLEHLKQFAEEGPADVGGSVQVIHNTLRAAEADPEGQVPAFREAAKQARNLVLMLNNTGIRVREVMASLSTEASTQAYVESFFADYVSGILISDYRDLRTTNHPLRNQHELLRIVTDLQTMPEARAKLAAGYQKLLKTTDPDAIDLAMSKDFDRFRRFRDIEMHLERLDRAVSRATKTALSYITYKLRTRDRLERLIHASAEAVVNARSDMLETPWSSGPLFNAALLSEPRVAVQPPPRAPIVIREMTLEQRAEKALRTQMSENRLVTAETVGAYLAKQMGDRKRINSDQMAIESINDLLCFHALARTAHARAHGAKASQGSLAPALAKYHFTHDPSAVTENDYLKVARFTVSLEKT